MSHNTCGKCGARTDQTAIHSCGILGAPYEGAPMSVTRYELNLPGDDIQGPFTVVLVVGREGQARPFTSIVTADDLLGVRQYLFDALTSKALYEDARNTPNHGGHSE